MSLDVSLYRKYHVKCECGKSEIEKDGCVYEDNITHNLGDMAEEAGLYYVLWRPEELGKTKASQIIELLEKNRSE